MIISAAFNVFLIIILTGFSFALKKLIYKNEVEIYNLDILYGLFFLILISLLLNFFLPLRFFLFIIILIGLYFFFKGLINKKIKINFFFHFIIIFIFTIIIYKHGDNVDTPMYHLQIIKWLYNEKIVFGLSNLEIRYGSNSLWFSLISILQFKYKNFNSIYTFNLIPFSILIYQMLETKYKLSYLFLALSLSFILLFSFLHPYMNGVILNHLHNTDIDTVSMIFFILSFFLFLKYYENENIENLRLLAISSLICLTIKLSYSAIVFLPLFAFIKFYKNKFITAFKDKFNILMISFIFLWFIKNLIISGCLVFLLNFTCFSLPWSPGLEEIETYSKVVKGFARDTRERLKYMDFQYTIESFKWFVPWFKDYALNNAFLRIFAFITFTSSFLLIFFNSLNLFDKSFHKNKYYYLVFLFLILPNFYVWFNAPETRFGWGSIITFCCFLFSIVIYHFIYLKKLSFVFAKFSVFIFLLFLLFDNKSNLSVKNFMSPYVKNINYSKIYKVKNYNGFDIYKSSNWKCYDFEKICINTLKDDYKIIKKYSYLIFLNS